MKTLVTLFLLLWALPAAAQSRSVFIEELTWPEVRDAIAAGRTTALYYAGSTEQNGPHMALGKHNSIARHVAEKVARQLGNALVYPVMPFAPTGDPAAKSDHMRFPGSVSVSEATYGAVAREVAQSAIAAGFRRVFLMGDHGGGQEVLAKVAADLDRQWNPKGVRVVYVPDVYFKSREKVVRELKRLKLPSGTHADIADTSELMFVDRTGKGLRRDRLALGDGKNGVEGDPRKASAGLGRRFIDFKIESAVEQIRKSAAR